MGFDFSGPPSVTEVGTKSWCDCRLSVRRLNPGELSLALTFLSCLAWEHLWGVSEIFWESSPRGGFAGVRASQRLKNRISPPRRREEEQRGKGERRGGREDEGENSLPDDAVDGAARAGGELNRGNRLSPPTPRRGEIGFASWRCGCASSCGSNWREQSALRRAVPWAWRKRMARDEDRRVSSKPQRGAPSASIKARMYSAGSRWGPSAILRATMLRMSSGRATVRTE